MYGRLAGFGILRVLSEWVDREVSRLDPGCFAKVMATGVISNAFFFEGQWELSDLLLLLNLAVYPILFLLIIWRIARFKQALWIDLTDPCRVFSFFTIVAGTVVLGVGMGVRGYAKVAIIMWFIALTVWLCFTYLSFGVLSLYNNAQRSDIVHGGWLIAIVATESLIVLGARVAPSMENLASDVFVLIHVLWGIGLGLYGIFITLFAQRVFLVAVEPDDITPLLWVVMGAAAISANAGSTLILRPSTMPFLQSMRPSAV